jgi:hypothetical protein
MPLLCIRTVNGHNQDIISRFVYRNDSMNRYVSSLISENQAIRQIAMGVSIVFDDICRLQGAFDLNNAKPFRYQLAQRVT